MKRKKSMRNFDESTQKCLNTLIHGNTECIRFVWVGSFEISLTFFIKYSLCWPKQRWFRVTNLNYKQSVNAFSANIFFYEFKATGGFSIDNYARIKTILIHLHLNSVWNCELFQFLYVDFSKYTRNFKNPDGIFQPISTI